MSAQWKRNPISNLYHMQRQRKHSASEQKYAIGSVLHEVRKLADLAAAYGAAMPQPLARVHDSVFHVDIGSMDFSAIELRVLSLDIQRLEAQRRAQQQADEIAQALADATFTVFGPTNEESFWDSLRLDVENRFASYRRIESAPIPEPAPHKDAGKVVARPRRTIGGIKVEDYIQEDGSVARRMVKDDTK